MDKLIIKYKQLRENVLDRIAGNEWGNEMQKENVHSLGIYNMLIEDLVAYRSKTAVQQSTIEKLQKQVDANTRYIDEQKPALTARGRVMRG